MATQPEELKLGCILVIQNGEPSSPLPLERTTVSGQIVGPVASVRVTQQFGNPFLMPIELEYRFPLPHDAAVVDYAITIGKREIRAEIKELEAARRAYREAVDAGKRASLLEQHRPNLFSIRLGNVQPNEHIVCTLEYEQRLSFEDGRYEFVFPMGITPRYHSPFISAETARSADSPLAQPHERIAPVELQLAIDAGVPVAEPTSPSHQIQLQRQDAQHLSLSLAGENIPNKDFVLRYPVAEDALRPAAWSSANGDSEIVLVTLIPPRLEIDGEPGKREFIFVIDRSGSMSTEPMNQARNALRACLRALNPQDTFAIQAFDDKIEWFSKTAQTVTQAAIDQADRWLDTIQSRGGTEILPAIDQALALPADSERQRYVVFLTDGSVSADEQAIRKIAKQRGNARIFTFGIGPSVNRFLLKKIAEMGRGSAEFLGANEDIEQAITRYQDRVSYPALQDIQLEWQGAESWDTYPETLPDLYVGQPLEIVTRLKRKGDVALRFSGQLRGSAVQMELPLPAPDPAIPSIKRLWARARVESIMNEQYQRGDQDSLRQQIISLSLEHRLLTPFTAFVAVDSEVTTGGDAKYIRVSTPLPEGLDYEGFVGGAPAGGVASLGGVSYMFAASAVPMARSNSLFSDYLEEDIDAEDVDAFALADMAADNLVANIAEPALDFASIDERIKWLARTQQVNGSWDDDIEMTAAAVLAFVRAGHTTRAGNYRQQVRKASMWLYQSLTQATGFPAYAGLRALHELEGGTGDAFVSDTMQQKLPAPSTDSERAAANDPTLASPAAVTTLDDLRVAALIKGNAQAPAELRAQGKLVQVWLALGKPV